LYFNHLNLFKCYAGCKKLKTSEKSDAVPHVFKLQKLRLLNFPLPNLFFVTNHQTLLKTMHTYYTSKGHKLGQFLSHNLCKWAHYSAPSWFASRYDVLTKWKYAGPKFIFGAAITWSVSQLMGQQWSPRERWEMHRRDVITSMVYR